MDTEMSMKLLLWSQNYTAANIPLEVMCQYSIYQVWRPSLTYDLGTDIDYMDSRHVFTTDPQRFPLNKMRELVSTLHERQQSYIVMVDPAVAYYNYSAFNNGVEQALSSRDLMARSIKVLYGLESPRSQIGFPLEFRNTGTTNSPLLQC